MAKKIIAQGANIDKLRAEIIAAIAACKKQEQKLTKKGVQIGRIYKKSDRPNSIYILEPSMNGKRKYVHVGTNTDKQNRAREEVARWAQRDRLRRALSRLEGELKELDWQIWSLVHIVESVHEHARMILEDHIEGKSQ